MSDDAITLEDIIAAAVELAEQQQPRPRRKGSVDRARVIRLYRDGSTVPEVARIAGHTVATIRRVLREERVPTRDDRKTHSGSKPKEYPPELVEHVRQMYCDESLSQKEVAQRLGVSSKVIQNVMRRYDIPARPQASEAGAYQGVDRAAALKARVAELGGSAVIREWARSVGIDIRPQGVPPAAVVEAFASRDVSS